MQSDLIGKWFSELKKAWLAKDVNGIKPLIADEVKYYENPLEPPLTSWEEISDAWRGIEQQDIQRLEITPLIIKDLEGTATYSFVYRDPGGNEFQSMGVYYVKLGQDGKALEFRQWWNSK